MKKTTIIFLFFFLFSFVSAFDFAHTIVNIDFTGNLTNLSEMQDVNIPSPSDGESLKYDSGTSKWIAGTVGAILGNCSSGQFVQNITASGLQCAAASGSGDITGVIAGTGLGGGGLNGDVTLNVSSETCAGGEYSRYNGTGFECFTDTSGSGGGKSGDGTYLYNDSTTMYFNETLAGTSLTVNSSDYWDGYNTANATQFSNVGGVLTLTVAYLTNFLNDWLGTKTTDDLTEGSTNLYDNQSWNESYADALYYDISNPSTFINWSVATNGTLLISESDPLWLADKSDYYNRADINGFAYYNLSDFDISDYYLLSNPFNYTNITTIDNLTIARIGDCPSGQFVQNTTTGGVECDAPAGGGDITAVNTDGPYLSGGTASGDADLLFNDTFANETYDKRYVNIDGDNMTGPLNMTDNPIHLDGITLKPLDEKNSNIGGPAFGVYMTGPSTQNLPHLIIQSGGASQASVLLRSQMIVNEIAGFHNTSDATDCMAYMNEVGEVLKIDCNTTTSGADLLVGDDVQIVGDTWLKDTNGEWHFMTRELDFLDAMKDETVIVRLNTSLIGTNITIKEYNGDTIIVNILEVNYDLGINEDSVLITSGTNSSPQFNHVYYSNGGTPTLTANTAPVESVADVMQGVFGSGGYDYGSFGGSATQYEFTKGVYNRFWDEGAIYKSGFDINASSTNMNFTTGTMKIILESKTTNALKDTSDLYITINSDGTFEQATSFDNLDFYATSEAIGNNKYFNVVFGIGNTQDNDGQIYAVVQDKPTTEYISVIGAETDSGNTLNFFPSDTLIKKIYIPIARGVMKNTGGTMTLQTLSNGNLFIDIRGQVTSSAGSSPSPGITVHSDLSNLDYASSGHTGFLADTYNNLFNFTNGPGYWNDTYATFNKSYADTLYRTESWDNFTGIPTATPSNGDTTHLSTADQIYDWVIGLNYVANAITSLLEDTTPQLGGYLDTNGNSIGSTSDEADDIYIKTAAALYIGDTQEIKHYWINGNCDLTLNHSMCSNTTGTYIIG